jgi:hypothetical protein
MLIIGNSRIILSLPHLQVVKEDQFEFEKINEVHFSRDGYMILRRNSNELAIFDLLGDSYST